MKLDSHVHTKYSVDALIEPQALAKKALALGITPAITDHNNMRAHSELRNISNFQFIPGQEISTAERFDLIGLFLNEQIDRHTSFAEALDKIKAQGGLSYLPHPLDSTRSGIGKERIALAKQVDIIEAFNARTIFGNANNEAAAVAEQYKKPKSAGSDSHFLFEFGRTYVELDESYVFDSENPKALLKALRSKNTKIVGKTAPVYARGSAEIVMALKKLGIIKRF